MRIGFHRAIFHHVSSSPCKEICSMLRLSGSLSARVTCSSSDTSSSAGRSPSESGRAISPGPDSVRASSTANFNLANGDRSSCETSCSNRRSAVSSVSMRSAITLNALASFPNSSWRFVRRSNRQIAPSESLHRLLQRAQRRGHMNRQNVAEHDRRHSHPQVIRNRAPRPHRSRTVDHQPVFAVSRRPRNRHPALRPRTPMRPTLRSSSLRFFPVTRSTPFWSTSA